MTALCDLAKLHGTDKADWYTPFYSLLLEPRRNEIKKMLEVGIGTPKAMAHVPGYVPGASLSMWRSYFPDAAIYGVDKDSTAVPAGYGIYTFHSDSRDAALAAKLGQTFDLIIDDGDHSSDAQLETFENLFPILRPGGLYIIEDAEDWIVLSAHLECYSHQVVLSPHAGTMGKLIVIRK